MLKLLKNLKESTLIVIAIVLLLCVQAVADLKLPNFTSDIVNVGIQQGGIESTAPEEIRESTLNNVKYFSSESEKIGNDYELIEKTDENIKKYPALENENVYKLKNISKEDKDELATNMAKPLLIVEMLSNDEMSASIKEQIMNQMKASLEKEASTNPNMQVMMNAQIASLQSMSTLELIKTFPQESLDKMLDQINSKLNGMSDSTIKQGAISEIKSEYEAIGIDIGKISYGYILKTGLLMLLVALVSMTSGVAIMFFSSRVAAQLGKTLREKVFNKVLEFSTAEFNKFSTASLITRSTNDIQQIQQLMTMLFRVLIYAPIMGIGGIILVFKSSNLSMVWIIALAIAVIIGVVLILFGTTMKKFEKMQSLLDKLNLVSREILTGLPVIRAFNTQNREEDRFDVANTNLRKNSVFVNNVMSLMMPLMTLIMQSTMILIVWFGGKNIDQGIIQVGDMMAFLQYTMQIIFSFLMISIVSIMLPRASISANRINEVLDSDISIKDKKKKELEKFDENKKGLVEFKDVSFKYPDADSEILADITFTAKPGETTAIIGSTGSGKSTVINLIPRFYDVTGGELLIDGANVKNVSQKDLRSKIGFVPQKGILFSGTIESNIKYGETATGTKISDEDMEKAASIAQATEFIEGKEETYKSEIAQGGNNVSGGQKQRLAIARALAIDPEIFVFDDSFSALDMKTDKNLREALAKQTKNKTVIIVAQRIGTIIDADQIIVLEDGKIVGKGKHNELMKDCETYKQIALSQLSQEELKRKEM